MYTMLETGGVRHLARRELIPFTVALAIAHFFYKFGSFTPELLAFLVTWFLLSAAQASLFRAPR